MSYDGSVAKEVNVTPDAISAINTSTILTTKEQISANTNAANVTGALAAKAMMADINSINSNLAGIKVYFDIKSISANLDWSTANFNDIYASMPNSSIACVYFELENVKVITEHNLENGGALILYKGTPWRGFGILSIYHNPYEVMFLVVNGLNELRLRKVNTTET